MIENCRGVTKARKYKDYLSSGNAEPFCSLNFRGVEQDFLQQEVAGFLVRSGTLFGAEMRCRPFGEKRLPHGLLYCSHLTKLSTSAVGSVWFATRNATVTVYGS